MSVLTAVPSPRSACSHAWYADVQGLTFQMHWLACSSSLGHSCAGSSLVFKLAHILPPSIEYTSFVLKHLPPPNFIPKTSPFTVFNCRQQPSQLLSSIKALTGGGRTSSRTIDYVPTSKFPRYMFLGVAFIFRTLRGNL